MERGVWVEVEKTIARETAVIPIGRSGGPRVMRKITESRTNYEWPGIGQDTPVTGGQSRIALTAL